MLEESQREILAQHAERRRYNSRVWVDRIASAESGEKLLAHILTAVVELAECQRGFLLVGNGRGEMTVRARYNLLAEDISDSKFDGSRSEFFERFSHGIRDGRLRARVVKLVPPRLARASTERERADVYLDFADRGSKVSFDKAPDLTPDEFQTYSEHFID